MKALLAALVLAAVPGAAQAIDVPGLGLDNPALEDVHFDASGFFGRIARVKGVDNAFDYEPGRDYAFGYMKAGQLPRLPHRYVFYTFPTEFGSHTPSTSKLSQTLVPIFAHGMVGKVDLETGIGPNRFGPFLQAIVYEPDQIKRKGAPGEKTRLQFKQKSWVAVRLGRFNGSGHPFGITSLSGGLQIEGCRAQVDLRNDPSKTAPTGTAKMKVKCSGKGNEVQRVRNKLEEILGKAKSGFDLNADFWF